MNKCHMHMIIWTEFRVAPHLYEVVSALILCLIKTIDVFDVLPEFLQCLSKISYYYSSLGECQGMIVHMWVSWCHSLQKRNSVCENHYTRWHCFQSSVGLRETRAELSGRLEQLPSLQIANLYLVHECFGGHRTPEGMDIFLCLLYSKCE